ncbi:hypothetical protein [Pseudonocardia sp. HH130630-07]|uniref:hypothetical protein n=1 Tax=Pseudonocardia sp. HH130630-07 TaxID=1690815 RepID=UPI000814DAA2|nr:hypothetical protein [Pseudonocardia sp. HH130630-07]ANY06895.1 hypothetical protein AFB00_12020 [Pseudonocardia sp. HH130630-07]
MSDPTYRLLLELAGRVDDDLLGSGRELVAVGEEGYALELLVAELVAGRVVLPVAVRRALVTEATARRLQPDPDRLLPAGTPEDACPHRFTGSGDADGIAGALAGLPAPDDGWLLAHRVTPAGSAPGPLPHPVLLARTGGDGSAEVLTLQAQSALARAGLVASVEVGGDGDPDTPYHRAARAAAVRLPAGPPAPGTAPEPIDPPLPDALTPAETPAPPVQPVQPASAPEPVVTPAVQSRAAPVFAPPAEVPDTPATLAEPTAEPPPAGPSAAPADPEPVVPAAPSSPVAPRPAPRPAADPAEPIVAAASSEVTDPPTAVGPTGPEPAVPIDAPAPRPEERPGAAGPAVPATPAGTVPAQHGPLPEGEDHEQASPSISSVAAPLGAIDPTVPIERPERRARRLAGAGRDSGAPGPAPRPRNGRPGPSAAPERPDPAARPDPTARPDPSAGRPDPGEQPYRPAATGALPPGAPPTGDLPSSTGAGPAPGAGTFDAAPPEPPASHRLHPDPADAGEPLHPAPRPSPPIRALRESTAGDWFESDGESPQPRGPGATEEIGHPAPDVAENDPAPPGRPTAGPPAVPAADEQAWLDDWASGAWIGETAGPAPEPVARPSTAGAEIDAPTPAPGVPIVAAPDVPPSSVVEVPRRPRHLLVTEEGQVTGPEEPGTADAPVNGSATNGTIPEAAPDGHPAGTGRPAPQPGPPSDGAPSDGALADRLTPAEQDLLQRLHEELAVRENGGEPTPRNGTTRPDQN